LLGDLLFTADQVAALESHAYGDKATYFYYLMEPHQAKKGYYHKIPKWLKILAEHGDDLPLTHGAPFIENHLPFINKGACWKGQA